MDAPGLQLTVKPLFDSVPIGAPVRVGVELENIGPEKVDVPASLSLKSEHVTGTVEGPSGDIRTFRSLIRCFEEDEHQALKPGANARHDLTLLRGFEGALFPAPGAYTVRVDLTWEINGIPVQTSGSTTVMVSPPVDDNHASAALKVLSEPDALLTLAIGGDHLTDGVEAIQAALKNPVLRPHYAVVEAKRVGNRFGSRPAKLDEAFGLIDDSTVMSESEIIRVAQLVQRTKKDSRKRGKTKAVISVLDGKSGSIPKDSSVAKMVKKL
jgi:hypothetical protein